MEDARWACEIGVKWEREVADNYGKCAYLMLLCYYAIMLLCYIILYYTILYYIILYYTILYYIIPYYTILYYIILYYTILYCYTLTPTRSQRTPFTVWAGAADQAGTGARERVILLDYITIILLYIADVRFETKPSTRRGHLLICVVVKIMAPFGVPLWLGAVLY